MAGAPSQKYDRQLRIWGEHGQERLGSARVCVLRAGATGCEALKNLVLGGVGEFTLVDGARVGPADLGSNFLVDQAGLGQARARVACALLQELNDSAGAKFVEEDPETLIASNPEFFASFTLVIATQMSEGPLVRLDEICRGYGCQLIIARSYGLMGLIRISVAEHCVIESKPDSALDDLRLHKPWPELQQLAEGYDLDIDDSALHSHIPFVVVLLKALREWNGNAGASSSGAAQGLQVPSTPQEKAAFKELVVSHRRGFDEENYKEALAAAFKVWSPPAIGPELRAILDDPAAEALPTSSDFWILVSALKGFMENEGGGDVPLEGSIPDMHSFTDSYVALQKVYRARADADISAVEARVQQTLKSVCNREPGAIPRDTVKLFCKNARSLQVLRYRPLREEYEDRGAAAALLRKQSTAEDPSHAGILYLLLRAADHFEKRFNRLPGAFEGDVDEEDAVRLKGVVQALLAGPGPTEGSSPGGRSALGDAAAALETGVGVDLVAEWCRFGGAELHCVAAVVGGIASQEAIKLITRQFTPIPGTFIYNAMSSTSSILTLS